MRCWKIHWFTKQVVSISHSSVITMVRTPAKGRRQPWRDIIGDFCLHVFSSHFLGKFWNRTHKLLLAELQFQNVKLVSLFSCFHTSHSYFPFSFRECCLLKATWHFFHQYFPCVFRKGPCKRVGIDTMANTLLLDTCPFRTFHSEYFLSLLNSL